MSDLPKWMQEFRDPPPAWNPPEELQAPTPSPAMNLAITMLSSSVIGNDLVELVGSWLSAMARLNIWFKDPGRRGLRSGEYPALLVLQGNVASRIYASWTGYLRVLGERPGELGQSEYDALLDAVREGTWTINTAMS